ncbi:cytochrome P450 2U1-like [Lineus longissimus]|uniref:cytochrome P450 2U1-like n=1 Tax=Lineus longissimus TaxID=88925 RepID=UPI002B4CA098
MTSISQYPQTKSYHFRRTKQCKANCARIFSTIWTMSLPPGPRSWPLIGCIPSLGRDLPRDAMRFSKELNSDIIHIKVGPKIIIFLNSIEAVEEAFSGDQLLDRPEGSLFFMIQDLGIVNQNGKTWLQHRVFLEHFLKENGEGYDCQVREEFPHLKKEIANRGQERIDLTSLFRIATANVASKKLFSKRFEYSDEDFHSVASTMATALELLSKMTISGMFPWLRYLSGSWGAIQSSMKTCHDFIQKQIDEHRDKFDPNNISDFVDAYLAEKDREDPEKIPFSEKQIGDAIADVMFPAQDLATTLQWAVLYLITHPDVQKKVQTEIDENVGKSELPSFKDRTKLPYTAATILEVQRVSSVAPLGLPRANLSHDVTIRSFNIPIGTPVLPNCFAIHRDPKLWKYPDDFNPENFLSEGEIEGEVLEQKRGFIPQSFGRRRCPGLHVAQVELFVFFASLLQSFEFSIPEGFPEPSQEALLQGTRCPHPFEVCAKARTAD